LNGRREIFHPPTVAHVAQSFQTAGSRERQAELRLLVPCRKARDSRLTQAIDCPTPELATGKSPEPADRNVCATSATPLPDAEISLAGGAQFGKTLLELNLAAYLTGQQFRNFGLYLPDDDLVEGIVDSKFRPDVVDQIDWFARMTQVGKALNRSGKAVNRKGAFLVTDGRRKAMGMVRGLGKVPTAFSMDVAAMDELDDLQPRHMKFVRGRLAASDLRFILKIGTQRIHGRGMNQAWKDGSQGVFNFVCPKCGRMHCAEEEFPQIVRMRETFNIQHSTPNIQGQRPGIPMTSKTQVSRNPKSMNPRI
jgi:phage terminase large subunit GpA-like protein